MLNVFLLLLGELVEVPHQQFVEAQQLALLTLVGLNKLSKSIQEVAFEMPNQLGRGLLVGLGE